MLAICPKILDAGWLLGCGLDLAGGSIKTKKCSFQYLNAQDAPILPQNKTRQARMATTVLMVGGEVNGKNVLSWI